MSEYECYKLLMNEFMSMSAENLLIDIESMYRE